MLNTKKPMLNEAKRKKAPEKQSRNKGGARPGAGRPKGSLNKVTTDVRAVFAQIMERNASKCEEWIERVAAKDPYKATDLLLRLAEFHVPKLARSEVTGAGGGAVIIEVTKRDLRL